MNIDKDKEVEKAVNGFKDLMSALGWNITQEKKTDNNELDENIEILKEMVIKSRDLREEEFYKLIGIKQIQAISRILSEIEFLKTDRTMANTLIDTMYNDKNQLKSELETYKKIAELFGKSLINISSEKTSLEELIDWAKREVENDDN